MEPQNGKIVRYIGGVNFANRGYFKDGIYNVLNLRTKDFCKLANKSNKIYSIESVEKVN